MSLEQALGKAERLWPGKQQFFRLLNLLLTLNFGFVHKISRPAPEAFRPEFGGDAL